VLPVPFVVFVAEVPVFVGLDVPLAPEDDEAAAGDDEAAAGDDEAAAEDAEAVAVADVVVLSSRPTNSRNDGGQGHAAVNVMKKRIERRKLDLYMATESVDSFVIVVQREQFVFRPRNENRKDRNH